MSKHRTDLRAGFVSLKSHPKGPNGRGLCRYCNEEVPKGRQTFCSEPCIHEWKIRSNSGYSRKMVWKRDHGMCALCGIDTEVERAKRREVQRLMEWFARRHLEDAGLAGYIYLEIKKMVDAQLKPLGWPITTERSWWENHHIIPVVEGGGCCSIDGMQTVCTPCHRRLTAELRKRLKNKNV